MRFLFLLALFSVSAFSQENAFLTPMGAYEGIAANTGIARDGSVGSVIYNPGGMVSIKSSKLSASGSAFSQNQITLKGPDGTDDVRYFQTTPAQISTVFTNKNFNWAFSILVPKASKFDLKSTDNNGVTTNSTYEDQETVFGPSIGLALSNKLKIGLSVFASKRDYRLTSSAYYEDGVGAVTQARKEDINGITAYPILGILFTPSENFSTGLRFSGPSSSLSGNLEDNVMTADNSGLGIGNSNVTKKGNATLHKPMELGLGFSVRASENLKILLDVTNQFKKEYEAVKEDVFGDNVSFNYKNTQRYNMAFEYMTSHTDALTFGLMYNPDPEKDSNLNFIGGTIGYRSLDEIADSSFGLFYNQASDKSDGIEQKQMMVGLFISTSINFTK